MKWEKQLEYDAKESAKESLINEEKQKLFINGALWTLEKLIRICSIHPMEDSSGSRQLCNSYRLKEVNQFIREMSKLRKVNDLKREEK